MTSHDLEGVVLALVAERKGNPRGGREYPNFDEAVRHARDPIDRANQAHLSGNALYLTCYVT